jgi:hypothetical protein
VRGVVDLSTHAGLWAENCRLLTSLGAYTQIELWAAAGSVLAACEYMTSNGIGCDRAALALARPNVAARARLLSPRWRVAATLLDGGTWMDGNETAWLHERFVYAMHMQGRVVHLLHNLARVQRRLLLPPAGCLIVAADFSAQDFFSARMLTGVELPSTDPFAAIALQVFAEPMTAGCIPVEQRRGLIKQAALELLNGGGRKFSDVLAEAGVSEPGIERVKRIVSRYLRRDMLERAVSFLPGAAAALDGRIFVRKVGEKTDAEWIRTAVNVLIANLSSYASRAAVCALHESLTLGLLPEPLQTLLAADGPCEGAFQRAPSGRAVLDARLTFWQHDGFFLEARAEQAEAVALAARHIIMTAAETAVTALFATLPSRTHAAFGGLQTLYAAGRLAKYPAKVTISGHYGPEE